MLVSQPVLLTPQKNGSGPGTMPVTFLRQAWWFRYHPSGAYTTSSSAALFRRRATAFSASSVLVSYQAAISASTAGLFAHPLFATSPLPRISLFVGLIESAPDNNQEIVICQPPWLGGDFCPRRATTVPQSMAAKSTFMPSRFSRSAVTSPHPLSDAISCAARSVTGCPA